MDSPRFHAAATRVSVRRLVAQMLDVLAIGLLATMVVAVADPAWLDSYEEDLPLWGYLVGFGLTIALFCWVQGLTGWTPGKLLCDIRVVRADGTPAGVHACTRRTLPLFIEFAGVVALVFMLRSPWRQRGGDRWAGTYVVKRSALPVPRSLSLSPERP